jgi:hypothetical protein
LGGRLAVREEVLVSARRRLRLFVAGMLLGVGLFLLGGVAVVPAHSPPQTIAQLQPWLLKTMCDYPAVVCTSRGAVVTSPSTFGTTTGEGR